MRDSLATTNATAQGPNYLPGYTPIRTIGIHYRDGTARRIEPTPGDRYITIGTPHGGECDIWLVFTSEVAIPFRWSDISKVEIEHLPHDFAEHFLDRGA